MSTTTDYCAHGMHVNAFHCVDCAEEHEAAKAAACPECESTDLDMTSDRCNDCGAYVAAEYNEV